jgi:peptide/nickel transport system substrate-binding protein
MAPRVAALLKGEVDIVTQLPPDQGERVKGNASTVVAGALYGGLYVLAVNSKVKPLDNPLVKQALSLAIDRETIIKELWRGRGVVPSGPIAKGDNHFDAAQPYLAYDPKEARERLKKAGYKGEEIVITTTAGYMAGDKPMAEAIQAMWKDVGINGKVEVVEYSVRAQMNKDKTFKGLWWSDPTSTLRDPDGMMWRLLGPGGPQDYWRHPRFDELGNAARFSVDEKFRGESYKEMTKIFLENFPWLPVIQPYEDYGLQKYVEFTPNPNQQFEIRPFNFKFKRA